MAAIGAGAAATAAAATTRAAAVADVIMYPAVSTAPIGPPHCTAELIRN